MSALEGAVREQQRALGELERCRAATEAWSDEQRLRLDRACLDPLAEDGRRLLEALRRAGRELSAAERELAR